MIDWDDPTAGDDEDCGMPAAIIGALIAIVIVGVCAIGAYIVLFGLFVP